MILNGICTFPCFGVRIPPVVTNFSPGFQARDGIKGSTGAYLEGGTLDVCRKDLFRNRSDWWFHDVYLALLLFLIHRDPIRKNPVLPEAIEDESS